MAIGAIRCVLPAADVCNRSRLYDGGSYIVWFKLEFTIRFDLGRVYGQNPSAPISDGEAPPSRTSFRNSR
jgi:hypothetical protein